jgi:hypothetical protein
MNGTLAWLLFIALYCFAVQRWVRDFRRFVEPPLRRRTGRALGLGIELMPSSRAQPTRREWRADGERGRFSALVPWLSVLVTALVVFAPVVGLYLAARYQLVAWHRAGMLLGVTLMVSCVAWLVPDAERRRAP